MNLSIIMSMAVFALAASISPGPVNLICLSCGSHHSIRSGLRFVTGATIGFVALFALVGLGLNSVWAAFPQITMYLNIAGAAFLLYISVKLFLFDGNLTSDSGQSAPSGMMGAWLQWLNPKAWTASAAGIAAFLDGNHPELILIFALFYLPICWLSLASWVYGGAYMRRRVQNPTLLRKINQLLAVLLGSSCVWMLLGYFPA